MYMCNNFLIVSSRAGAPAWWARQRFQPQAPFASTFVEVERAQNTPDLENEDSDGEPFKA